MTEPDSVERSEPILPGPTEAMAALFNLPRPTDEVLGFGWQWAYLLDRPATADLGRDGHPARNVVPAPPGPGRRRMWAGGRMRMVTGLRVGDAAIRRTRIESSIDKTGRTGRLTIVTVKHDYLANGEVALEEWQDLVYRDESRTALPPAAADPLERFDDDWEVATSSTLLFRFSALTYNGHRIHYDRDYAKTVEGYPGLVVHGPIQALLMAQHARHRIGVPRPGDEFEYRLVSPVFDDEGLVIQALPDDVVGDGELPLRVCTPTGRVTARGCYSRAV
ncbi:MaoC family dehydratase N-terminal domain-containing protein [Ammonicoccus fulvus]|uniref:MaoC family dehydratase N-terminal domain-containing protein n=1 Tax=Ammonicoccus fulvus TaxID=3138240 RepID=A0ABZ3FNY7_9ACTN